MRSIRGYLKKLVQEEVKVQLNVMFHGRKAGPRQQGVTRVRRKADKAKAVGMGNVYPLPEPKKRRRA